MVWDIVAVVAGTAFVLLGFVGSIVPVIPGPLLAFAAILLVHWASGWSLYPPAVPVALGVVSVGASLLDNVLPATSSRRAGAGRAGVVGSVLGMIAGSVFLGPLGTILGAFLGAYAGEVLFHRENEEPLKAALGVFRGTVLAMVVKLASVGVMAAIFLRGSVRLFS